MYTEKNCCNICKDLMPLVKDGVASKQSRGFVLAHIGVCEDCRSEYEGYPAALLEEIADASDRKIIKRAQLRVWVGIIAILLLGLFLGIDISTAGSQLVFLVPIAVFAVLSIIDHKANPARTMWVFGTIVVYVGAYFIWRNIVLFEHDIGAWVAVHCTFLSVFIGISAAYFSKYRLACLSIFGYNFGIIAGGLWGQTSFDPGGGLLHNGWLIWIFVFIGCVIVGSIAEIIKSIKAPRS